MISTKLFLLLFIIIKQSISQQIQSLLLSKMINTKYQCNSTGCSPSTIISGSNIKICEFACLTNRQCRTVTFDPSNQQCKIFFDIPSQYGQLLAQTGVVTMVAIDDRQLSARKYFRSYQSIKRAKTIKSKCIFFL